MEVIPLQNKLKKNAFNHKHSNIIKFPNKVLLVGGTGVGKSVCLHSILEQMYKNFYDELFFFSVNASYEPDNLSLKKRNRETKIHLIDSDYIDNVNKIWERVSKDQKARKNKKMPMKKYCFVIDDLITNIQFMQTKAVNDLYIMGRKYNCQIFSLSQKYRSVPLLHRLNTQNIIVFNDQNRNELKKISEEHGSGSYDEKFFIEFFKNTLSKIPYSFLHINKTVPINRRFMLNFQHIIEKN